MTQVTYKNPISVLVVIYTLDQDQQLKILLLKQASGLQYWQASCTGSYELSDGDLTETALREIFEETDYFNQVEHSRIQLLPRTELNALQIANLANADFNATCVLVDLEQYQELEIYPSNLDKYQPGSTNFIEHQMVFYVKQQFIPKLSTEHSEYQWLDYQQAVELVGYPSNIELLEKLFNNQ